jgi:hypothetical protein
MVRDRVGGYLYGIAAGTSSVFPFQVLGLGYDSREFEIGPLIAGVRTHVTEMLGMFVIFAFVARIVVRLIEAIVAPGLRWAWRKITHRIGRPRNGDACASGELAHASKECVSTGFYLWTTIAIPSVIFLVAVDIYFYHYYFVFCPFVFVLVAVCMLPWRSVLLGMVVAQALLSCAFLSYVHQKGGTARGEYGITYAHKGNR